METTRNKYNLTATAAALALLLLPACAGGFGTERSSTCRSLNTQRTYSGDPDLPARDGTWKDTSEPVGLDKSQKVGFIIGRDDVTVAVPYIADVNSPVCAIAPSTHFSEIQKRSDVEQQGAYLPPFKGQQ